jgi:large subunit ribosomal protein LP2
MKHIAAFALLVLGGKDKPTAADVEKLLKEAGVKADSEKIEKMIAAFEGKNFHEMVEGGLAKMSAMGSSAAPVAAAGAAKVEETVKEEVEEVDMGNLFGGDDEY